MLGNMRPSLLLSVGCIAAAAQANPVDLVPIMTQDGKAVPTPHALYVSLADAGSVFTSDATGQILFAGGDDTNAALYLMLAGPSNTASGEYIPFDVTPFGGEVDSPSDPGTGSVFETLRPDGMPAPGGATQPQWTEADSMPSVVVPLPGAGALAAAGLAFVMVRPRRKR